MFSRPIAPLSLMVPCLVAFLFASQTFAKTPLHERIDSIVDGAIEGPVSMATDDAEFVRRIYLDLAGRIPTAAETNTFRSSKSATKRSELIDSLVGSDQYAEQWANLFHIMLMERRGDDEHWRKFLVKSFKSNKPWRQLAKEIVSPAEDEETTQGAAYFYTKRLEKYGQNPVDYPGLVRDVGRLFLGVDVQCAQCHDHLFVDDYKQVDYQGLYAFVGTTFIRRDTTFPAVAEKPLQKKIEFQSVFDMDPMTIGPRLPGGTEVAIPQFKRGEEYSTPPDRKKKTPGVLKFSPLKALGEELTRKENKLFARNIVNRIWWALLGRGLVDPQDLHHADNLPSHPALLELLADEFVKHDHDMAYLIREIVMSQTYQRSSLLPSTSEGKSDEPELASYRTAIERPLSAKQLLDSVAIALDVDIARPVESDKADAEKSADAPAGDSEGDSVEKEPYSDLLKRFRDALSNPPREPETAVNSTVKSALFLMHDPVVLEWLKPNSGNLTERLDKIDSAEEAAHALYLSVLSRRASAAEIADVKSHLNAMKGRTGEAWAQLAWSLLASTEFYVNH